MAGFVGRDRGYRALSFAAAPELSLADEPTVRLGATADDVRAIGAPWVLAVGDDGEPMGWVRSAAVDREVTRDLLHRGGTVASTSGSLRALLDAALSSPSGRGVVADDDGRLVGTITAAEVVPAIEARRAADTAGRVPDDGRPSAEADEATVRGRGRAHDRGGDRAVSWALDHLGDILFRAGQHAWLAGLPLVLGLLIALPLGWLANRTPWLRATLLTTTGLLYTIPSLALFILLPSILGTKILDPFNVIVAMTIYTVALLTRTVADGLSSVDPSTRQAAIAMGYGGFARFRAVDLPLAVPVIAAGLRVAAVSNVSIVSVASLIGISQLGYFLTDGYARSFPTEVWVGIVACLILALVFDLVIQVISRLLTPWTRAVAA